MDFFKVKSFEKPVFALKTEVADDGGSGMNKINYGVKLLTGIVTLSFLCIGCTNKLLNERIFTVTDGVYTMESIEDQQGYAPTISFDTHDKTFVFSYDLLSSYFNCGTYVIQDDEVIATTSDGRYTYTFKIVDDDTISFIAENFTILIEYGVLTECILKMTVSV